MVLVGGGRQLRYMRRHDGQGYDLAVRMPDGGTGGRTSVSEDLDVLDMFPGRQIPVPERVEFQDAGRLRRIELLKVLVSGWRVDHDLMEPVSVPDPATQVRGVTHGQEREPVLDRYRLPLPLSGYRRHDLVGLQTGRVEWIPASGDRGGLAKLVRPFGTIRRHQYPAAVETALTELGGVTAHIVIIGHYDPIGPLFRYTWSEMETPKDLPKPLSQTEWGTLNAKLRERFVELSFTPEAIIEHSQEFPPPGPIPTDGRPFLIYRGKLADGAGAIFKVQITPEGESSSQREGRFLQAVAPKVLARLPEGPRTHLSLPEVVAADYDADNPYILYKYLEGEITGPVHEVESVALDATDVAAVAAYFTELGKVSQAEAAEWDPDLSLQLKEERPYMEINFDDGRRYWAKLLEADLIDRLEAVYRKHQALVDTAPPSLKMHDVNPANLIRMPDGHLGLIDWERIGLTTNGPSSSLGYFHALLWAHPDLQQAYRGTALSLVDDDDFLARLWMNTHLIWARGELIHWDHSRNHGLVDAAVAETHIRGYQEALRLAVDPDGPWAEVL